MKTWFLVALDVVSLEGSFAAMTVESQEYCVLAAPDRGCVGRFETRVTEVRNSGNVGAALKSFPLFPSLPEG